MFHIIKYKARRKKIQGIKTIARPVLSKAIHACSDHFTEVHLMKAKRSPQHLLGDILKYILKPDAVPSLFPNGKTVNKSVSPNIEKTINLRKVKGLCKGTVMQII